MPVPSWVVSPEQMASDIGGETVILGLKKGRYYGLDAVGGRVWQLLQIPTTVEAIAQTIVAEYEVELDRCRTDLLALVQQMMDVGVVEEVSVVPDR